MSVVEVNGPVSEPAINARDPEKSVIVTTLFDPGSMRVRVFLDNITVEGARDLLERGALPQLGNAINAFAAVGAKI